MSERALSGSVGLEIPHYENKSRKLMTYIPMSQAPPPPYRVRVVIKWGEVRNSLGYRS